MIGGICGHRRLLVSNIAGVIFPSCEGRIRVDSNTRSLTVSGWVQPAVNQAPASRRAVSCRSTAGRLSARNANRREAVCSGLLCLDN